MSQQLQLAAGVPPPLRPVPPDVRREDLLSINTAALKWNAIVHLQARDALDALWFRLL